MVAPSGRASWLCCSLRACADVVSGSTRVPASARPCGEVARVEVASGGARSHTFTVHPEKPLGPVSEVLGP